MEDLKHTTDSDDAQSMSRNNAGDEKKLMIGYGDTVWVRVWIMLSYCFCTLCLSGLGLGLGMAFILGKNLSAPRS